MGFQDFNNLNESHSLLLIWESGDNGYAEYSADNDKNVDSDVIAGIAEIFATELRYLGTLTLRFY